MNTKQSFLIDEFWALTFGSAFKGANVFSPNASKGEKEVFRLAVAGLVELLVEEQYEVIMVSSEEHIENLVKIKEHIDNTFSGILRGFEIKLGVVQKLLNLYLKYQWCVDNIPEPPHCPFDRKVIKKLGLTPIVSWSKLNTVEEYLELVGYAEKAAVDKSIGQWELETFKRGV